MTNQNNEIRDCPCGSEKQYSNCCRRFHYGELPAHALELMRSRYSAYALGLTDYIIQTTHPGSPQFSHDLGLWSQEISEFCLHTQFKKLEILETQENSPFATVTFTAHLMQNQKDVSFSEKSYFEKIRGKWLYRSGKLSAGRTPNLITTDQLRLLPLAYYGDPILRKVADPIVEITQDIRKLVEEMVETMDACDGIGLAAPQVHHSIQLFIIRKPIEKENKKVEFGEVKVFINPKVSSPGEDTWKISEGCLSIPTIHGDVERPKEISVEYSDLEGRQHKERVSGWEARVIMHENDHINGILFIDHLDQETREKFEPFLQSLHNRIHNGKEFEY